MAQTTPSRCAVQSGLFALKFLPENFYYMNLAVPRPSITDGVLRFAPDEWGGSMWIGTPALLYLFVTWRQWWQDHARRTLVLGTVPIVIMLLLYHNTGWRQLGHYRFSLDFLPIILAVVAPFVWGRRRTPVTIAMLLWSVLYFRWIVECFPVRFS